MFAWLQRLLGHIGKSKPSTKAAALPNTVPAPVKAKPAKVKSTRPTRVATPAAAQVPEVEESETDIPEEYQSVQVRAFRHNPLVPAGPILACLKVHPNDAPWRVWDYNSTPEGGVAIKEHKLAFTYSLYNADIFDIYLDDYNGGVVWTKDALGAWQLWQIGDNAPDDELWEIITRTTGARPPITVLPIEPYPWITALAEEPEVFHKRALQHPIEALFICVSCLSHKESTYFDHAKKYLEEDGKVLLDIKCQTSQLARRRLEEAQGLKPPMTDSEADLLGKYDMEDSERAIEGHLSIPQSKVKARDHHVLIPSPADNPVVMSIPLRFADQLSRYDEPHSMLIFARLQWLLKVAFHPVYGQVLQLQGKLVIHRPDGPSITHISLATVVTKWGLGMFKDGALPSRLRIAMYHGANSEFGVSWEVPTSEAKVLIENMQSVFEHSSDISLCGDLIGGPKQEGDNPYVYQMYQTARFAQAVVPISEAYETAKFFGVSQPDYVAATYPDPGNRLAAGHALYFLRSMEELSDAYAKAQAGRAALEQEAKTWGLSPRDFELLTTYDKNTIPLLEGDLQRIGIYRNVAESIMSLIPLYLSEEGNGGLPAPNARIQLIQDRLLDTIGHQDTTSAVRSYAVVLLRMLAIVLDTPIISGNGASVRTTMSREPGSGVDILTESLPKSYPVEDYWDSLPFIRTGIDKGTYPYEAPFNYHKEDSLDDIPEENEQEAKETFQRLLSEAQQHKTWVIPPDALVSLKGFGLPFTHVRIVEVGNLIQCFFKTPGGEYYTVTISTKAVASFTGSYDITRPNLYYSLLAVALIRDFWVVENRRTVYDAVELKPKEARALRVRDNLSDNNDPIIIYLPRCMSTSKKLDGLRVRDTSNALELRKVRITHQVTGHARYCLNPNPEQVRLGALYNIPIPPDHTFVKEHWRGLNVANGEARQVVYRSSSALQLLTGATASQTPIVTTTESWFMHEDSIHRQLPKGVEITSYLSLPVYPGIIELCFLHKGKPYFIQAVGLRKAGKIPPALIAEFKAKLSRLPTGTIGILLTPTGQGVSDPAILTAPTNAFFKLFAGQ